MERFAFKIDKTLRANLYKICRLCGIDNPEKVTILGNTDDAFNVDDCEPELWRKIQVCIGFTISKDDKMPQTMCSLCVDKINDFFEFREMCFATNAQTRKLLGLKEEKLPEPTVKEKKEPLSKIKEQTGKLKEPIGKNKEPLGRNKEILGKNKEALGKNKEPLGKNKEPPIKIKEDLDVKLPIVPPAPLGKRTLFGKGKRKRKAEEMLAKTTIKEDVEEIKQEKPSTSTSIMPMRKKLRLSSGAGAAATTATTTTTNTSSTVTNASSTSTTATTTTTQKRTKPLTPMQRRALEQAEKKLKPKDEIKEEVTEPVATSSTETKATPAPVPPKLPPKFTSKFKQLCNICDQRFINKAKLERHLYDTHVPTVPRYFCTACNETMKKGNEIKNHQLWHKLSKTPFVCGLCGERLLNSYAYARHLREHIPEVPTAMLVLDRQCPQCQETFATTFLYNIHPCSLKTKKCAGCNRNQKSDVEYLKHASVCPKMFINYSKHISAAAVAAESNVRIKNENDVEAAAAAEALARSSAPAVNMTPVVSLTRLSAPMLMQSNQCVLIPSQHVDMNEELQMSPTTSNAKTSKKTNKKGVSRKELKRVDELLKSTMDTLVSIKHEPEVHMDTCEVMPEATAAAVAASSAVEEDATMEDSPPHSPSPPPADDFQNDSTHDDDENESLAGVSIKQELVEETEKIESPHKNIETPVKHEIPEEDANPNKIPVLKLKITKEHGKLNSSIVQQEDNTRSEKKKKKKKRKDTEKDKERLELSAEVPREDAPISMPQPGIVHIKQERMDDDEASDHTFMEAATHNNEDQLAMPPLVMTTIPQPLEFKISCISSGVDFDAGGFDEHETAANVIPQDTAEEPASEPPCDEEMQDIKPCREALDRLLKISQVSGGVEMSQDEEQVGELQQNTCIPHDVEMPGRHKKSKVEKSPSKSKKANRRAVKSTSGVMRIRNVAEISTPLPQIVAISSGNDVAADTFSSVEPEHAVVIKEERLDEGYGDQIQRPEIEESQMQTDDDVENCSKSIQQSGPQEDAWSFSTTHDSAEHVAPEDVEPDDIEPDNEETDVVEHGDVSSERSTPEHSARKHVSVGRIFPAHVSPQPFSPARVSPTNASTEHASPENALPPDVSPESDQEMNLDATSSSPQREELCLDATSRTETLSPQPKDTTSAGNALSDSHQLSEEQAYIANIDFNNIIIKQEKDIEVSEVQLNESVTPATMLSNGLIPKQQRRREHSKKQFPHNNLEHADEDMDDDEELDEDEDDEDEDDEEEYEEDDQDEQDDQDEEFEEEREYRELEMPPMLVDNVNAMPSTISIENNTKSIAEEPQTHSLVDYSVEPLNERDSQSPLMLISNVYSGAIEAPHSPITSEAPAAVDQPTQHHPVVSEETDDATFKMPPPQFKILSVVSENAEAAFEPILQPEVTPAFNNEDATSSTDITEPDSISGCITQDGEADLVAQPFFEPQSPPSSTISDVGSLSEETATIEERLDTYEELQNQLNHEMLSEQRVDTQTPEHSFVLNNFSTLPTPIEDTVIDTTPTVFSCNINSDLYNRDSPTTSSQAAAPLSKLNEETENLINESNDAAARFQTNTALLTQQPIMLRNNNNIINLRLDDDSNINEIAENNNNANIERELQDDSLATNERLVANVSVEQASSNEAEAAHLIDLT